MATALYRRYRPESFAEVIGQDHVTTPLRRALRAGRVGHAYLFSGPRGCGKTTSARILARCLNCEQGPTDTPCGECDSCRDLARGGSGSLDVVEIDAASHGGVDDARELRERASFAPVRDRYKVFIIDEAHMVTSAGFNALLKLVEEPPEHVKFVFATTEPDKVIGTIRSRTHHYPFRLIPPQVLAPYLDEVCSAEGVSVGEGVMPLVVRAGGGSARDSMSVLDQLMAGAGEGGLDFQTAIALLGFTDTALLDGAITAVAERDAGSLYGAVEHVLATGHEPRRFVEDLLERMRDLIVLAAVPDRGADLLPQVPADELERMRGQATMFAPADLSQCGDLVHETLSTMSGATSPRLHLELLAARLVLRDERAALAAPTDGGGDGRPVPAQGGRGGSAEPGGRGGPAQGAPQSAPGGAGGREEARRIAQERAEASRQARSGRTPAADEAPQDQAPAPQGRAPASPQQAPPSQDQPSASREQQVPAPQGGAGAGAAAAQAPQPQASQPQAPQPQAPQETPGAPAPGGDAGGLDPDEVRSHWSAILDELSQIRRPSWALISQNGHVHGAHGSTLVVGFRTEGLLSAFHRGTGAENLADAVRRIMHTDITVEAVVGEDPGPGGGGGSGESGPNGPGNPRDAGSRGVGQQGGGQQGAGQQNVGPQNGGPSAGPSTGEPRSGGPQDDDSQHPGGAPAQAPAPTPAPWGDAVTRMAPSSSSPEASPEQPLSAGQRASERAMRAAARASYQSPGPAAPAPGQVEDFPPEPDDPFPPDPRDAHETEPRSAEPVEPAPGTGGTREAPQGRATAPAQHGPGGTGRWSDALAPDAGAPAAVPGRPERQAPGGPSSEAAVVAAPAAGDETSGGAPVVDDEGRDSLPPEEPRTYGQAALKRAIAEGRVIRSRPARNATAQPATGGTVPAHAPEPPGPGSAASRSSAASPGSADSPGSAPSSSPAAPTAPAASGAAASPTPMPPSAASAPTDESGSSWGAVTAAARQGPAEEIGAAPAAASEPSNAGESASARAAASWGTAAVASAPAPEATSATTAEGASTTSPARSGAALVREAAQASRTAGLRSRSAQSAAEQDAPDADPTGGATRDDENAVVAQRNGREIIEAVLGGRVLEVIDETERS
ncbi:DNA polymerase III subunit gamma/tau [Brachybacterium sp. P6-10-X1]|uniref:DNA polymerase III subunit gamma and tau n=1 Tax=Brachybacterium sp. P6-10-X1 TaxID=1903186 RepID=UPI0009717992|nr:DNA polymerase III subunit gamma and tau [Brachybacterium sp. P6-10-X1]APX33143.1 DNA polymerase III subunit gamma/tau [Brachybacterium sp. P6-10-X1]